MLMLLWFYCEVVRPDRCFITCGKINLKVTHNKLSELVTEQFSEKRGRRVCILILINMDLL